MVESSSWVAARPTGRSIATTELYDTGTGTFSPTGSMTVARYWPSLALLPDGRMLVVGFSAPDGSSDCADSADRFQ